MTTTRLTARPGARPDLAASSGSLVLVATPIGNLGDLSPRAVTTLGAADVIACEDTRHTRRLLTHAGISPKALMAVHDHNEATQVAAVLALLHQGKQVAVVSDAGTPGVSDPGARLAAAAAAAGASVLAVPGPSAALAALVVSGLPTGRWCFEGFLPRKGTERAERLAELAAERRTTVIYEAPHRLAATLSDLAGTCGPDRQVAVARELTKVYEEVWRGTLAPAAERAADQPTRGEHVIVLAGAPPRPTPGEAEITAALESRLGLGQSAKEAVPEVAADLGVPKRQVYEAALRWRGAAQP